MVHPVQQTAPLLTPAAEVYSALAPAYDDAFETPLALAENAIIFREVARLVRPGKGLVDIGCGTSLLLRYLPLSPVSYLGVDLAPGMLAEAKRRYPDHAYTLTDMADLHDAIPVDGAYDVAVNLFGSFTYCEQPRAAISEMLRILAPWGRFFLMVSTPRYDQRPSYILARQHLRVPCWRYRAAEVRALFAGQPVGDLRISGFHALAETHLPGRSQPFYERYLSCEMRTLGRLAPDACYNLLVTGRRL